MKSHRKPWFMQMNFRIDYPKFSQLLDPVLTGSTLAQHRDDLRDLAGLFILMAPDPFEFYESEVRGAAGAAYVILDALRADPDDCGSHINFAVLVGFGDIPRGCIVDKVFKRAVEACPGDPTPRWTWGLVLNSFAVSDSGFDNGDDTENTGFTRAESMKRSLDLMRDWVQNQPGSSLAFAGEAEAFLAQAEVMNRNGAMPFTARAYASRALERFRDAHRLEPDDLFLVGQARSLGGRTNAGQGRASYRTTHQARHDER